jgi:hypothetical protein
MAAAASEGFSIAFRGEDFQEHFQRGSSATSSLSEVDESNKSKTHIEAQPVPPPPAEVEDVHPSLIVAFADEAFSKILKPEDCDLNFLLAFRGLASNFSCSEV